MSDKLSCVWSKKGVWVVRGEIKRFERNQTGALSPLEAAAALGVYDNLIYRLIARGALKPRTGNGGRTAIPVRQLRALQTAWKYTRPTTRMGQNR
jgi:hypothetical protein